MKRSTNMPLLRSLKRQEALAATEMALLRSFPSLAYPARNWRFSLRDQLCTGRLIARATGGKIVEKKFSGRARVHGYLWVAQPG
jgi:hypothetical protein